MEALITNTNKDHHDLIFEQEFYPHFDAVYNFAYRLTGNEADASDLLQETFLKACRFIESYNEGTNAKAWLFRICKNAFINDYRKRKNRGAQVDYEEVIIHHQQDETDTDFSSYTDLRIDMFDQMLGDEVSRAVDSLNEDFQVVIVLSDVEGFTYEEISKIIDIPIGTVRSRLFRARNELKGKLANYAADNFGIEDKR